MWFRGLAAHEKAGDEVRHVTLKKEHRGHESLNKQRESAAPQGGVRPCSS